jgi:hypothetical protein
MAALGPGQVAIGDRGRRPLGEPQRRQLLRRCIDIGSPGAPIRRPDETLAVDVRRQTLYADQLAAEFFDGVVVEPKAKLYPAVGNPALGDETPKNFLQDPREIHDAARLLPAFRGRPAPTVRNMANASEPLLSRSNLSQSAVSPSSASSFASPAEAGPSFRGADRDIIGKALV